MNAYFGYLFALSFFCSLYFLVFFNLPLAVLSIAGVWVFGMLWAWTVK